MSRYDKIKKFRSLRSRLRDEELRKAVGEEEFNRQWDRNFADAEKDRPLIIVVGIIFLGVLLALFLMME